MIPEIATFEKVSYEQYKKDRESVYGITVDEQVVIDEYNAIKLPKRSTGGSAGYDFYTPVPVFISNVSQRIPTGIRCHMEPGWVLMIYPRSSLGFNYGMCLSNTTGIIDSDYYYADNEGHIIVKVTAAWQKMLEAGDRFVQGIFFPFGKTKDDDVTETRSGGFGSTGE